VSYRTNAIAVVLATAAATLTVVGLPLGAERLSPSLPAWFNTLTENQQRRAVVLIKFASLALPGAAVGLAVLVSFARVCRRQSPRGGGDGRQTTLSNGMRSRIASGCVRAERPRFASQSCEPKMHRR